MSVDDVVYVMWLVLTMLPLIVVSVHCKSLKLLK